MKFFAVLAAATLAIVSAAPCDETLILPLISDADLNACTVESGLLTVSPASAGTLTKACASKSCQDLFVKVVAMNLGDCMVGAFMVETDFINPLKKACPTLSATTA